MTSGEFLKQKSRAEKSQSGNHVTTIIQDFTLVSLTSSVTPDPAGLLLGAAVSSLSTHSSPTHSSPYALISLRTRLPMHSSYRYVRVPAGKTFHRYLSEIVHLSRRHPRLSQYATKKLSCWLNAIDAPPLCGSQPRHQSTRVTGWTTSGHLQYVISLMTKDHFQYAIEYSGKLVP